MSDLTIFDSNTAIALPDYLNFEVRPLAREISPAQGADYISLKGNRFRCVVGGQEMDPFDTTYLDVVILGSAENVSRVYYATKYDPNAEAVAPTCYSADGKKPSDNVVNKQAEQCNLCPQNVKGSALTGDGVGKACSYFRRLAVMIVGDPEGRVWRLDVKSKGLFGTSYPQLRKFNLNDYARAVSRTQFEFQQLVTRLSFDSNDSVPKLLFEARSVIDKTTAELVKRNIANYAAIEDAYKVEYGTSGASASAAVPAVAPAVAPAMTGRQQAPAQTVATTPVMQTTALPHAPNGQVVQPSLPFPAPAQNPAPDAAPSATMAGQPVVGTTANIQRILEKLNAAKQA